MHTLNSILRSLSQRAMCTSNITTHYSMLFGSSTRGRHAGCIYRRTFRELTLNVSCMTISGGRTEQLDIFCHVTGFMSDFLSFIVVELIRFFHGALHLVRESEMTI